MVVPGQRFTARFFKRVLVLVDRANALDGTPARLRVRMGVAWTREARSSKLVAPARAGGAMHRPDAATLARGKLTGTR